MKTTLMIRPNWDAARTLAITPPPMTHIVLTEFFRIRAQSVALAASPALAQLLAALGRREQIKIKIKSKTKTKDQHKCRRKEASNADRRDKQTSNEIL